MSDDSLDFINFNDVEEGTPTIPDGEYLVRITDMWVKETKDGTGKYISYRWVVQSGEHAGHSDFAMWSLKPEFLWRFKRDCKALGYVPENGVPDIKQLIGLEAVARIKEQFKQDKDTKERKAENGNENRIDRFIPMT